MTPDEPTRVVVDIDWIELHLREPLHLEAGSYVLVVPQMHMPSEYDVTLPDGGTMATIKGEVLPVEEEEADDA